MEKWKQEEARTGMAWRWRNKNLPEERLGIAEESLSMSMGSMVVVAPAPACDGAVLGLAVDPLPPMVAAGARCSAHGAGKRRRRSAGKGKIGPIPSYLLRVWAAVSD